jgi:hypothetical protein
MSDDEIENIEIHGREGLKETFRQNEQEGLSVSGIGTTGDPPSLDIVLTEYRVYVIHGESRDIVSQVDIPHHYEPVEDRDGIQEPTEPKDGAIEEAIDLAQARARGFMRGWKHRHDNGPRFPQMQEYAEGLPGNHGVLEVVNISETDQTMNLKIQMDLDGQYGFVDGFYDWEKDHEDLEMRRLLDTNEDEEYAIVQISRES